MSFSDLFEQKTKASALVEVNIDITSLFSLLEELMQRLDDHEERIQKNQQRILTKADGTEFNQYKADTQNKFIELDGEIAFFNETIPSLRSETLAKIQSLETRLENQSTNSPQESSALIRDSFEELKPELIENLKQCVSDSVKDKLEAFDTRVSSLEKSVALLSQDIPELPNSITVVKSTSESPLPTSLSRENLRDVDLTPIKEEITQLKTKIEELANKKPAKPEKYEELVNTVKELNKSQKEMKQKVDQDIEGLNHTLSEANTKSRFMSEEIDKIKEMIKSLQDAILNPCTLR